MTTLYKHLLIATDGEIYKLVYFLLQQAVGPFLEMLGKWIYYGIVDDNFSEFMIIEHTRPDLDAKSDMFDWHDRFSISHDNVVSGDQDAAVLGAGGREGAGHGQVPQRDQELRQG